MDPDGAVRALVGGLDYGESQFNRATHAYRQPGSSFKLYVYATALEHGYHTNTMVRDAARPCGNWHPQNYSGGYGGGSAMPLWLAFAKSLNTVAAELSFAVGREKVIEMTRRLGVKGIQKSCSMALGDHGITPLEHTAAYATFANGGVLSRPYAILDVFNSKGELVYERGRDEAPAPRVVRRRVVEQMNQLMQRVVTEGTGKRAALDFTHAVGKTGTSSHYRDAWFMGFTGQLVTGVWLGNDDYRPMSGVTGGTIPAIAWHGFMSVAHTNMNIPPIMGLPPHPMQVAEQQRVAELRRTEPTIAAAAERSPSQQKMSGIMPTQTRDALKRLVQSLHKASGLQSEPSAGPDIGKSTPAGRRTERTAPAASTQQASAAGRL
jgi:penicillin-binding protein 1A